MKVVLLTVGSRGEVQPCIALGLGLQAAGHEVTVATHANFEAFVRGSGLDFALLGINPQAFLQSEAGQKIVEGGGNPVQTARRAVQAMRSMMRQLGADCWAACQGAEAILYTIGGFYFAPSIAEKLTIPSIGAYPYPASQPTRAFPNLFAPTQRNLGGVFNRLTHTANDGLSWLLLRSRINEWRQEQLALPPLSADYPRRLREQKTLMLFGFSPSVVPKPPDWGQHVEVTGYWFLDNAEDWQPPAGLVDFLGAGPAPVYVGFGSMTPSDPQETTEMVLRALGHTGQRGLLVTAWGGLGEVDLPQSVYSAESIPFDWLFPQMAAVVHHGGSGTTAAGLRAGVPSVIVPFMMDQPFWGRRVTELGVGPGPIPHKKLTVERLSEAIKAATTDADMRKRAAELGRRIRGEDGVARAVEALDRYLSER